MSFPKVARASRLRASTAQTTCSRSCPLRTRARSSCPRPKPSSPPVAELPASEAECRPWRAERGARTTVGRHDFGRGNDLGRHQNDDVAGDGQRRIQRLDDRRHHRRKPRALRFVAARARRVEKRRRLRARHRSDDRRGGREEARSGAGPSRHAGGDGRIGRDAGVAGIRAADAR